MEIPDRIKHQLDGESVQSAVNLGDEDVICFTPTRTLLYRGEGLLSDESLEEFRHDVERLKLSEGRRKTTFSLEYVDTVESFSVSNKRAQKVLRRLLAGVLRAGGVIGEEETVHGAFLFSELTVVVTDSRLVKHIGTYVWDPDYEEYPYSAVTELEFEEGSVATQIVLSVDGRPQRIKAPSDEAKKLRRTLSEALFAYHEVDSLDELNEAIAPAEESASDAGGSKELGLDDSISPLVDDDEPADSNTETESEVDSTTDHSEESRTDVVSVGPRAGDSESDESDDTETDVDEAESDGSTELLRPDDEEIDDSGRDDSSDAVEAEAMREELSTLRTAVQRQNELLEQQGERLDAQSERLDDQREQIETQRETIEQLIEELRKYA